MQWRAEVFARRRKHSAPGNSDRYLMFLNTVYLDNPLCCVRAGVDHSQGACMYVGGYLVSIPLILPRRLGSTPLLYASGYMHYKNILEE